MDNAARDVATLVQHVLPARPHHLAVSAGAAAAGTVTMKTPVPAPPYTTYVSEADRGVLLTRPYYELEEEAAAVAPTTATATNGVPRTKPLNKRSFKDYQERKRRLSEEKKEAEASETNDDTASKEKTSGANGMNGTTNDDKKRPAPADEGPRKRSRSDASASASPVAARRAHDPSPLDLNGRVDGRVVGRANGKSPRARPKEDRERERERERKRERERSREREQDRHDRHDRHDRSRDAHPDRERKRSRERDADNDRLDRHAKRRRTPDRTDRTDHEPPRAALLPPILSPLHLPGVVEDDAPAAVKNVNGKRPAKTTRPPPPAILPAIPPLLSPTLPAAVEEALLQRGEEARRERGEERKDKKPDERIEKRSERDRERPDKERPDADNDDRREKREKRDDDKRRDDDKKRADKDRTDKDRDKSTKDAPSLIVTLYYKKKNAKRVADLLALRGKASSSSSSTPTLSTKSTVAGKTLQPPSHPPHTPVKSVAMARAASNTSQARTPGEAAAAQPGVPATVTPRSAERPGSATMAMTASDCRHRYDAYLRLGTKLKHDRDAIVRSVPSGTRLAAAAARRVAALSVEMVLSYMVAFRALNRGQQLERRAPDAAVWERLLPHVAELRQHARPFKAIETVALQLRALVLEQLLAALAGLGLGPGPGDEAAAAAAARLVSATKHRMEAWAEVGGEQGGTVVGPWLSVEEGVRVLLGVVRRWSEREGVGWEAVLKVER